MEKKESEREKRRERGKEETGLHLSYNAFAGEDCIAFYMLEKRKE